MNEVRLDAMRKENRPPRARGSAARPVKAFPADPEMRLPRLPDRPRGGTDLLRPFAKALVRGEEAHRPGEPPTPLLPVDPVEVPPSSLEG